MNTITETTPGPGARTLPTAPHDLDLVHALAEADVAVDALDAGEPHRALDLLIGVVAKLQAAVRRTGWHVPPPWADDLESENVHRVIRAQHATLKVMHDTEAPATDRADAAVALLHAAERHGYSPTPTAEMVEAAKLVVALGGRDLQALETQPGTVAA